MVLVVFLQSGQSARLYIRNGPIRLIKLRSELHCLTASFSLFLPVFGSRLCWCTLCILSGSLRSVTGSVFRGRLYITIFCMGWAGLEWAQSGTDTLGVDLQREFRSYISFFMKGGDRNGVVGPLPGVS